MKNLLLFCLLLPMMMQAQSKSAFVQVKDQQFLLNGSTYTFLGTNFWYGHHLGAYDTARLIRELDRLAAMGVQNLRILGSSEGPDEEPWRMSPALQTKPGVYNEALLKGMDKLLVEMRKRNMKAVVVLNNFWPWSGGMAQYRVWVN
ncbi:MAG TPA: beta-mannosidase, partial [Chitinophagaceae bacterium]|nr:beta-mannosidase [Chitinophagaceae bacterium]